MATVYRIQLARSPEEGAFHSGGVQFYRDGCKSAGIESYLDPFEHPSPNAAVCEYDLTVDGFAPKYRWPDFVDKWLHGGSSKYYFGCLSLALVHRWFPEVAGRMAMERNGYVLAVYETDDSLTASTDCQTIFQLLHPTTKLVGTLKLGSI